MTAAYIIGPNGEPVTRDDLPDASGRWTPKRKALVVAAIRGGLITLEEAGQRYHFSPAEIERLGQLINQHSLEGARVTYAKQYR